MAYGYFLHKIATIVKLHLLFNSAEKNLNSSSSFEILSNDVFLLLFPVGTIFTLSIASSFGCRRKR